MTPESSAPTQPGSSAREPETEAERSRLDVLWDEMWVACLGRWHRGRPVWEIRADIEREAREQGRREGLDVDRLARAMRSLDDLGTVEEMAAAIVAEYARFAPQGRDTGEAGL